MPFPPGVGAGAKRISFSHYRAIYLADNNLRTSCLQLAGLVVFLSRTTIGCGLHLHQGFRSMWRYMQGMDDCLLSQVVDPGGRDVQPHRFAADFVIL